MIHGIDWIIDAPGLLLQEFVPSGSWDLSLPEVGTCCGLLVPLLNDKPPHDPLPLRDRSVTKEKKVCAPP